MGATKTVTGVARAAFDQFVRDVQEATRDGRFDELERARLQRSAQHTAAALTVADNRMRLIRFATGDVRSVRDIEEHAARNNVTPLVFDFGPDPQAA